MDIPENVREAIEAIEFYCEYQMCGECHFMLDEGCLLMHKTPDVWTDYIRGDRNE